MKKQEGDEENINYKQKKGLEERAVWLDYAGRWALKDKYKLARGKLCPESSLVATLNKIEEIERQVKEKNWNSAERIILNCKDYLKYRLGIK